ncbi:MAG: polysaccharide biosynthesis tyrosine autokinase [Planctomycetota bacterium]|nr:polysaccharide biosynthesis tyrosine autokinase [Planctomycetota bacterium]
MAQISDNSMNMANLGNISGDPSASSSSGFDIIQVLWRWKWLPVLGSIIGAGLGYLYFTKQSKTYRAEALVQVINSMPSAPNRGDYYDPNELIAANNRSDESLIIRSQKVLEKAVASGQLTEKGPFQGASVDSIVDELTGTRDLVIEPAAKDAKTTMLHISYVSTDPELAATVVNAIVDGYGEYLSEEYQSVGNKIYEVVNEGQQSLEREFQELNKQMLELQVQNPEVIWTADGATDPYAENYTIVSKELLNIQMRQKRLSSTLQHIENAVKAGRSAETILLMLSTSDDASLVDYYSIQQEEQSANSVPSRPELKQNFNTESARLERNELFDLKSREKQWLAQYGDQHPTVGRLREQIKSMEEKIAGLRQEEIKIAQETQRLMQEAMESQISPEGITVDERLEIRRMAMAEELASIQVQVEEFDRTAKSLVEKSFNVRSLLNNTRLINDKRNSIQTMLNGYTDKLNAIELLPQAGQRTLKELNLPKNGGQFAGPYILPYVLGGAAVGFVLLSGLAVLMDLADRSYRNPEEIANDLGIPVLGHIPVMDISKVKKSVPDVDGSVSSIHHSKGRVSEAYRSVRTGLYFSQYGRNLKVVQVTSPVPGDGKSTLSSNLAVSMAQSGRRVLLIDADFRRPRIANIFGIDGNVGMASVIAGQAEIDDAIHQGPVANLSVMPGGKRPNNPAELLSSQRFTDLIELLREKFDFIVIDTPPLLAVSDPSAVAGVVDGVVLTMRLRRNVKPLAIRATSILDAVGAQCLGVVVNGVSSEAGYGYNYDYNDYRYAYKYGSDYRLGYGYSYGYGNYGSYDEDASSTASPTASKEGKPS